MYCNMHPNMGFLYDSISHTVKAPNIAHLSLLTSIGYNNKQTWNIVQI